MFIAHVLRIGTVEAGILERQGERAALPDVDAAGHPGGGVQRLGGAAELGGEVDAGDLAAEEHRRDPPRRPADAAADIEDALAGARLEQRHQLARRRHAAAVEMVQRSQRIRRDGRVRPLRGPQRGKQARGDVGAGVVVGDAGGCRAQAEPPSVGVSIPSHMLGACARSRRGTLPHRANPPCYPLPTATAGPAGDQRAVLAWRLRATLTFMPAARPLIMGQDFARPV